MLDLPIENNSASANILQCIWSEKPTNDLQPSTQSAFCNSQCQPQSSSVNNAISCNFNATHTHVMRFTRLNIYTIIDFSCKTFEMRWAMTEKCFSVAEFTRVLNARLQCKWTWWKIIFNRIKYLYSVAIRLLVNSHHRYNVKLYLFEHFYVLAVGGLWVAVIL